MGGYIAIFGVGIFIAGLIVMGTCQEIEEVKTIVFGCEVLIETRQINEIRLGVGVVGIFLGFGLVLIGSVISMERVSDEAWY